VNFQRVLGYPFEINTGTRVAAYHISDIPSHSLISSIFWLTTHTHAAVWLAQSCNQCVQLGLLGAMVQEKRNWEHCSSWTVLHAQCTSALSSEFPLLQGNAALERWHEKTKHHLISYFLSNTSAKKYHNRIMCVNIIVSQRWGVFFETQCTAVCSVNLHSSTLYRYLWCNASMDDIHLSIQILICL